jgi:hypothetical protein
MTTLTTISAPSERDPVRYAGSPRFTGVLVDAAVDGGAEAINRTANPFEAGEVVARRVRGAGSRHGGKNAWPPRVDLA